VKARGQLLWPKQVTKFCPYEVRHYGHAGQEVGRGQEAGHSLASSNDVQSLLVCFHVEDKQHLVFIMNLCHKSWLLIWYIYPLLISRHTRNLQPQISAEPSADFLIGKPRHICLLIIRLIWSSFQLSKFNNISSVKHILPYL